jgi:hypothetical protein
MQTEAQPELGVACNARHNGRKLRERRRDASRSMVMNEDGRDREREGRQRGVDIK